LAVEEMKAADSRDAVEVGETLVAIENEIGSEQFNRLKAEAEHLSTEEVIDQALA
jgi:hypothetical protein